MFVFDINNLYVIIAVEIIMGLSKDKNFPPFILKDEMNEDKEC